MNIGSILKKSLFARDNQKLDFLLVLMSLNFLDPTVLSAILVMRLVCCSIYLLCGYACRWSNATFLIALFNTIRVFMFFFDALALLALLLGYVINTGMTIVTYSDGTLHSVAKSAGLTLIAIISGLIAFLILKGRLSSLFAVNLGTFGVALLFLGCFRFKLASLAYFLQVYGNFGVCGSFLLLQMYGFSFSYMLFRSELFLTSQRGTLALSLAQSKLLQRFDTWWGEPSDRMLFRNYAMLNLNQLHLVYFILVSDEVLFLLALCVYCFNVIPCILIGLRHWHRMTLLTIPTFGFVAILLDSYTATLKQLLEQWKWHQAPAPKASAVIVVICLGLGSMPPAFASDGVDIYGETSDTPPDSGQGSPTAEGQRLSVYARQQTLRAGEQIANAPSNAAGNAATNAFAGTAAAGVYASGYQHGFNDGAQEIEQNTAEAQASERVVKPSWLRRFLWSCINKPAVKKD